MQISFASTRLLELGGLGVPDLRYFGFALRLRWEWLRRVQPDRSWAALAAKTEAVVAAMCAASMSVVVGDGASALLWTDCWRPEGPLCKFAPALFVAVSRAGRKRTLREGLQQHRWVSDIVGALTTHVLCDYLRVWRVLEEVQLDDL